MASEKPSAAIPDWLIRPAGAAIAAAGAVVLAFAIAAAVDVTVFGTWQGDALFYATASLALVGTLAVFVMLFVRATKPDDGPPLIATPIFDEAGRRVGRFDGRSAMGKPMSSAAASDLEHRLYDAIEGFPEGLALWDADDRLILANATYYKLAGTLAPYAKPGVTFEELLRLGLGTSSREESDLPTEEIVTRRLAHHRNPGPPIERPLNDGRWLQIREHRTRDGGTASFYTDITALKRVQIAAQVTAQELGEKQQQLDVALNNISQGIAFFDAAQKLVLCNRRYRELYRLTDDMAQPGTSLKDLLEYSARVGNYPAGEGERVRERRLGIAERRQRSVMETRMADGRYIEVIYQPLEAGGSVATFMDVTDRENSARALVSAKEAAESANRAKTEFLTKMSHELRTPLNAIIGFSEIIRDRIFGSTDISRYAEYAADISFSGHHLLQVINDILDMARIEAGQYHMSDDVFDLGEQITHAQSMLARIAKEGGVALVVEMKETLPPLRADRRSVLQVLLNLLSNAVKFTPSGGTVTASAWRDRHGDIIAIVSDTGIGIARADQERIFEPFFQADAGNSRRFSGTGLGLSICRNIMMLHDGSIDVASELGRGTRIAIRFPAARVVVE